MSVRDYDGAALLLGDRLELLGFFGRSTGVFGSFREVYGKKRGGRFTLVVELDEGGPPSVRGDHQVRLVAPNRGQLALFA